MKIGILTVHDSANFGSYLQAIALKDALETLGHTVTFVKTRSRKVVRKVFMGSVRYPRIYLKNRAFNKEKFEIMIRDIDRLPEIELRDVDDSTLDCLVIGSDELWNVRSPVFRNPYFYGAGIPVRKKVVYAVSMGAASYEEFMQYPKLVDAVKALPDILVRDRRTFDQVKRITGEGCPIVCDPTFLADPSLFDRIQETPVRGDYLLVYSYDFDRITRTYIRDFAREKNLKVVSCCMKHEWADENINCSALQFCKLIQDAHYVATTTFHGAIFSILNNKQFLSAPFSEKVTHLLESTGMQRAVFNKRAGYEGFCANMETPLDFSTAEQKIAEMRKTSLEQLRMALERG